MVRTKNAKRARIEGESSASARLIASSHYMARWLPSPRALNNYVEKFESRAIVPPRYITPEFIHNRHYNLVWNALQTQHLTDFVQTKDDYYPHLVRAIYNTLNYVVPEPDEEVYHEVKFTGGIAADEEWGEYNRLVGLQSLQYENPHMDARGNISCSGLGNEQRILITPRQMGRDRDAQEPQIQGQLQDPEVQAQSQEPPSPPPPSPSIRDLMDELRSIKVYMEEQFADMRQHQDRQTEVINRQGEAIDLLYTNLGITNLRGIIPRPRP
ncbi:hypothetical protein S83_035519 [Arachis hypogaea]